MISTMTGLGPKMCFNSVKSWQSGWYRDGQFGDKTREIFDNSAECLDIDLYGIAGYGDLADPFHY